MHIDHGKMFQVNTSNKDETEKLLNVQDDDVDKEVYGLDESQICLPVSDKTNYNRNEELLENEEAERVLVSVAALLMLKNLSFEFELLFLENLQFFPSLWTFLRLNIYHLLMRKMRRPISIVLWQCFSLKILLLEKLLSKRKKTARY